MVDEPELSEQMKTLIAIRMPESKLRFWRELFMLFVILFGMALGFGLFAVGQYWVCVRRWPDKTFSECMRYDVVEPKRGRK
jgi:hypothetical protein